MRRAFQTGMGKCSRAATLCRPVVTLTGTCTDPAADSVLLGLKRQPEH